MKYRKKPVVIEAIQFLEPEYQALKTFCPQFKFVDSFNGYIDTLEGTMSATEGDWIIKGVHGEFYPCKPDIFAKTYEDVTESIPSEVEEDELSRALSISVTALEKIIEMNLEQSCVQIAKEALRKVEAIVHHQ
jgi:hypothetical protein